MNHDMSIEHALALIDALQAAGAIDPGQKDTLRKACSENTAKSPEQLFCDSGLFDITEITSLTTTLQLIAAGRISKELIAIGIMSALQSGKSRYEALKGLEDLAKSEEASILPDVIVAFKREIDPGLMKELEKRLTESPQISWEEHVRTLNILKPRHFEIAKLGQSMIDQGEITSSKFSVALYDYLTGMCTFEESLQVRGWWPRTRT